MTAQTTPCPTCRYALPWAGDEAHLGGATPNPGSFSMCIRCGALLEFDEKLRFKKASNARVLELAGREALDLLLAEQRSVRSITECERDVSTRRVVTSDQLCSLLKISDDEERVLMRAYQVFNLYRNYGYAPEHIRPAYMDALKQVGVALEYEGRYTSIAVGTWSRPIHDFEAMWKGFSRLLGGMLFEDLAEWTTRYGELNKEKCVTHLVTEGFLLGPEAADAGVKLTPPPVQPPGPWRPN